MEERNPFLPTDEENAEDLRIVWSSKKVEQLMEAMDSGAKIQRTPFYEGNPGLRRGNIVFEYTEHELNEIKKCTRDINYFADNYCTVMTDEGLRTIKLRDYQKQMLAVFQNPNVDLGKDNPNNRTTKNNSNFVSDAKNIVVLAARQSGKTITSSIYIAWYTLFNYDRNTLILSNKGATTREIIDKAKTILDNLPFFMKPGTIKNDVFNLKFDNGCRIIGQSTTKKAAIGFTIHLLFMDEFAHIAPTFIDSFYENVYPTISSSKVSKVIITSTPFGFNKFHEIYSAAENGMNEYRAFRIDWWQVPGRDEKWMINEIRNLGSEEAFNRQYGNQFIASSNLLLGPADIRKLKINELKFVHNEFDELDDLEIDYSQLLWHPQYRVDDLKNSKNYWCFSVDIAEGNGGDASVINIFRIEPMQIAHFKLIKNPGAFLDFFRLRQIAAFRSNEHSIEDFAKILYTIMFEMFEPENVKMIIEWNTFGSELLKQLQTVFPKNNEFDEEMIVKFKHRNDATVSKFGLKLKKDNKTVICQNFKKLIKLNKIIIQEKRTIAESMVFGKNTSGSYSGQRGNDDMIMTSINASEFFTTIDYSDFVEEAYDSIDEKIQQQIDLALDKNTDKSDGALAYDIYDLLK